MTVTLFIPCFVDLMYPKVGISMVQILERLGHTVECPEKVACCGQPAFNSGCWEEARTVAVKALEELKGAEVVVVASGSCGAMLKNFYPELFAGTEHAAAAQVLSNKTYEFSDFLVSKLGVTDLGARFEAKVTFHDGCHGLRELKIKQQPRQLLAKVRGLELVELREEVCCGFGGTFAAKFPTISTAMGDVKCAQATETGAEYIVSNDSSCLMHIQGLLERQGKALKTIHLAEILRPVMSASSQQFKEQARLLTRDFRHRDLIQTALRNYEVVRDKTRSAFQDWGAARQAAAERKWEAVNHLDTYLVQFEEKLTQRGTHVHWASTGEQARELILGIIKQKKARSVIKSKSMTSEEIHLNEALEQEGFQVVESDLGEFIVQLRKEAPYHIVFPAMHLTRGDISELFARELGSAPTQSPEELTMIARRVLRQKYITADVGFTGANFAIAETGMISITENEGNARLTAALPKVMITLVGIEKVLPRFEDLALFLPMLSTMGTGQALTCYNSFYGGPRQPGEPDGPEEYHVVLLDNRRTELLADAEQRDALHCIRCGACLNVCPIFRNVGGHTYGTTYSGPIGSVITPHLRGLQNWKHLSFASSLCGACTETCPVKINLHHHLLQNRRNAVRQKPSLTEKLAFKLFALVINRPAIYGFAKRAGRLAQRLHPLVKGTRCDPAYAWTRTRELPPLARQSFKEYWRERKPGQRQESSPVSRNHE